MVESDTSKAGTPRKKYISAFVDTNTMIAAGFNYHETSAILPGPHTGRIYVGHIGELLSRQEVNNVIVERVIDHRRQGGRRWTEWYFQSFERKERMDCDPAETIVFEQKVYETVRRRNRVAGRNLAKLLRQIVKSCYTL